MLSNPFLDYRSPNFYKSGHSYVDTDDRQYFHHAKQPIIKPGFLISSDYSCYSVSNCSSSYDSRSPYNNANSFLQEPIKIRKGCRDNPFYRSSLLSGSENVGIGNYGGIENYSGLSAGYGAFDGEMAESRVREYKDPSDYNKYHKFSYNYSETPMGQNKQSHLSKKPSSKDKNNYGKNYNNTGSSNLSKKNSNPEEQQFGKNPYTREDNLRYENNQLVQQVIMGDNKGAFIKKKSSKEENKGQSYAYGNSVNKTTSFGAGNGDSYGISKQPSFGVKQSNEYIPLNEQLPPSGNQMKKNQSTSSFIDKIKRISELQNEQQSDQNLNAPYFKSNKNAGSQNQIKRNESVDSPMWPGDRKDQYGSSMRANRGYNTNAPKSIRYAGKIYDLISIDQL